MKKFKALFITAIFLFVTSYVPQTSVAVSAAEGKVTLFRHGDYTGEGTVLPDGNYSWEQFAFVGNNQLSSLRIPSGMVISVFDNSNFTGDMRTYTNDIPFLTDFNDRTSSVRVGKTSALTTVYEHGDFGGRVMSLLPGGYTLEQIAAAVGNDKISSVKVPGNYRAYLYEHGSFEGRARSCEGTVYFLNDFNDVTSSISIVPQGLSYSENVKLFKDKNYSGEFTLLGEGNYRYDQFLNIGNNQLTSMMIPPDLTVYVYDDDNFGADMRVYTGSVSEMTDFKNRTSSIRIVKKSNFVIVYEHGDFGGKSMNLIPGVYSSAHLEAQVGNDKISSVKMPKGYIVYLYDQDYFKGGVRVCTETVSFLTGFNDLTSSIIVAVI